MLSSHQSWPWGLGARGQHGARVGGSEETLSPTALQS